MVDHTPEVEPLTVDLCENLIDMPSLFRMRVGATLSNLFGKDRAKSVPPEAHGLMADIDPAFVQNVLNLTQAERVAGVVHHRQLDDLRACLEVLERGGTGHFTRLGRSSARLKVSSSDNTAAQRVPRLRPHHQNPVDRGLSR